MQCAALCGAAASGNRKHAMDVSAYDLLSTAVLLLDAEGRIDYANTAAEELFGGSRRMLLGQLALPLLGGDDALRAHFAEALAGRLGVLKHSLTVDRNGVNLPVHLTLVPLPFGQAWSALIEVRVSEQHLLLERHQQLGKDLAAQREVLRNLAHEVKNPLGGIRGAAQLLDSELENPALREYTEVIIAEADRLAHLVDRLSAPQGGSLHKQSFNIHELCERVRTLVSAEFKGIDMRRDYDASLPELSGDFSRLLQALLNIARNAAQALTEHGGDDRGGADPLLLLKTRVARQVLLAQHQARMAVIVSVIDNGPGVPPELADRLFHPLVTGRPSGTGLGLSLAQEFVQQHGGVLEWESRPGHSEFRMILPMEQP